MAVGFLSLNSYDMNEYIVNTSALAMSLLH